GGADPPLRGPGLFLRHGGDGPGGAGSPGPGRGADGGPLSGGRPGLGRVGGGVRRLQLLVHPPGVEARRAMITNRIKEHRARLNLKQEELAKLVGVRRETIGNLEKGKYNPSLVLAWNIAQVFGVPIEEVFTVTPDQQDRP